MASRAICRNISDVLASVIIYNYFHQWLDGHCPPWVRCDQQPWWLLEYDRCQWCRCRGWYRHGMDYQDDPQRHGEKEFIVYFADDMLISGVYDYFSLLLVGNEQRLRSRMAVVRRRSLTVVDQLSSFLKTKDEETREPNPNTNPSPVALIRSNNAIFTSSNHTPILLASSHSWQCPLPSIWHTAHGTRQSTINAAASIWHPLLLLQWVLSAPSSNANNFEFKRFYLEDIPCLFLHWS